MTSLCPGLDFWFTRMAYNRRLHSKERGPGKRAHIARVPGNAESLTCSCLRALAWASSLLPGRLLSMGCMRQTQHHVAKCCQRLSICEQPQILPIDIIFRP